MKTLSAVSVKSLTGGGGGGGDVTSVNGKKGNVVLTGANINVSASDTTKVSVKFDEKIEYKDLTYDGTNIKEGTTALTFTQLKAYCDNAKYFVRIADTTNTWLFYEAYETDCLWFNGRYEINDAWTLLRLTINDSNDIIRTEKSIGGGGTYTAGDGISIEENAISVAVGNGLGIDSSNKVQIGNGGVMTDMLADESVSKAKIATAAKVVYEEDTQTLKNKTADNLVETGTTNAENIVVSGDLTCDGDTSIANGTVSGELDVPTPTTDNAAANKKYIDDENRAIIAAEYTSVGLYTSGDYCLHSGKLYICTYDMTEPEAWNADHWNETKVVEHFGGGGGEPSAYLKSVSVVNNTATFTKKDNTTVVFAPTYTKADVGLSNVDNTADSVKPVSTPQQNALDLKINIANIVTAFQATPDDSHVPSEKMLKTQLEALSGKATIKVVDEMPENPQENTLYYVGTESPYHIYLRSDEVTYDMGTTEIDLSGYVKITDIVNDLTSSEAAKPLSAAQGKTLNDNKQDNLTDVQLSAVNSGITSDKITSYDNHIADADIHVTTAEKDTWNGKQDALNATQISAVNSGITSTLVTNYSEHIADTDIHVTTTEKNAWDAKQTALTDAQLLAANSGITAAKVTSYDNDIETDISSAFTINYGTLIKQVKATYNARLKRVTVSLNTQTFTFVTLVKFTTLFTINNASYRPAPFFMDDALKFIISSSNPISSESTTTGKGLGLYCSSAGVFSNTGGQNADTSKPYCIGGWSVFSYYL